LVVGSELSLASLSPTTLIWGVLANSSSVDCFTVWVGGLLENPQLSQTYVMVASFDPLTCLSLSRVPHFGQNFRVRTTHRLGLS